MILTKWEGVTTVSQIDKIQFCLYVLCTISKLQLQGKGAICIIDQRL